MIHSATIKGSDNTLKVIRRLITMKEEHRKVVIEKIKKQINETPSNKTN